MGAIEEAKRLGLLEAVRIMIEGCLEVPQEMAHLPFTVLEAFREAKILGQDFDGGSSKTRFQIPPCDRQAFESAWQDRSRGGSVDWNRS
jgi:hypothetical protein